LLDLAEYYNKAIAKSAGNLLTSSLPAFLPPTSLLFTFLPLAFLLPTFKPLVFLPLTISKKFNYYYVSVSFKK